MPGSGCVTSSSVSPLGASFWFLTARSVDGQVRAATQGQHTCQVRSLTNYGVLVMMLRGRLAGASPKVTTKGKVLHNSDDRSLPLPVLKKRPRAEHSQPNRRSTMISLKSSACGASSRLRPHRQVQFPGAASSWAREPRLTPDN